MNKINKNILFQSTIVVFSGATSFMIGRKLKLASITYLRDCEEITEPIPVVKSIKPKIVRFYSENGDRDNRDN